MKQIASSNGNDVPEQPLPSVVTKAVRGTAPVFRLMVRHQGGLIEPRVFVFARECVTLGRAEGNEVVLSDELRDVSRRHAEIRWKHGHYRLVDLDSKNETRLNERPLKAGWSYLLRNGDRIEMGCYWIDFFLEEATR